MSAAQPGVSAVAQPHGMDAQHGPTAQPVPTCTVMAAFFVMVWYIPMKATLLSKS